MHHSLSGLTLLGAVACCAPPRPAPAPRAAPTTARAPTPLASPPPHAPPAPANIVDAIMAAELSASHTVDLVRAMTALGPRPSGSRGDAAMVEWAQAALVANGFANVHVEKVMVPHWERGEEKAAIVAPVKEDLRVTALGGSAATPQAGLEADVVEVESVAALEKMDPRAVAKRIVFINAPTRRAKDGSGYGETVRGRFAGARVAQRLGAIAMVLRSVGTNTDRAPHTGAKSADVSEIPAAAVSPADADVLHHVLATKTKVRLRLVLTPRWLPDAESGNVVGEIVGAEKPDEVVVVGAHHDAWDPGLGALDDGAGCAIAIEVGRLVGSMPRKPKRTIRIVLFANEENGRKGALGYAKAHAAEAPNIVAAMEADFGADRVYQARFLGDPARRGAFLAIAATLKGLGVEPSDEDAHGGTDTGPLHELGVPAIELRQDGTRYFDFHHTANDTVDKIDPDALAQAAASYALAAWGAADMAGDLGRVPEEKREEKW